MTNWKPRPRMLDHDDEKAKRDLLDRKESEKARVRAKGRCEIVVIGEGRCSNRDAHTHHMIGGWKLRGRGPSALAQHKQRACVDCHRWITGHVLKVVCPSRPHPLWTDRYERCT